MSALVDSALNTLTDPDDRAAIAAAAAEFNAWRTSVHSQPLKVFTTQQTLGMMPVHLMTSLVFSYYSSVLHSTAMEQLQGQRPAGDWDPVMTVSP